MGEMSLVPSSSFEAAELLIAIAPKARSKGERRLIVWRKLRQHFSFNRIAEIDRCSSRITISAEEMQALRAAATGGTNEYQALVERLNRLELEVAEVRQRFDGPHPQMAGAARRFAGLASDPPVSRDGRPLPSSRAETLGASKR